MADESDEEFDLRLATCAEAAIVLCFFMAVVVTIVGVTAWRLMLVIAAGPVGYAMAWFRFSRR